MQGVWGLGEPVCEAILSGPEIIFGLEMAVEAAEIRFLPWVSDADLGFRR